MFIFALVNNIRVLKIGTNEYGNNELKEYIVIIRRLTISDVKHIGNILPCEKLRFCC